MAEDKAHSESHGEAHGEEHKGHKGHKGGHGGHGKHEEHEEGVPEWVVSFADNALLQMGFFAILLAMNMGLKATGPTDQTSENPGGPPPAMLDAMIAIREAFNSPVSMESTNPNDGPLIRRMMEKMSEGTNRSDGVPGKNPDQQAIRPSDYNRVTGSVGFEQDEATLTDEARRTIADVAKRQRGQRFIVEVRGHVSAMEAARGIDAAVQLSFQRAQAVAAVLVENGIAWSNLRVVASADNERLVAIATDARGHRSNQRVEIVVTDDLVANDPHAREQN